jgi:hypothetical protein
MDYQYTFHPLDPAGKRSLLRTIFYPVRRLLGWVSPWLLSTLLGGASLMVIALTPAGMKEFSQSDQASTSSPSASG